MPEFRYAGGGATWYKGNAHIHSTASDGGSTFAQLAAMYAGAGYDFLFRTDHWVCSDVAADPATYPLLWLDGIELDGHDRGGSAYHVACLGTCRGVRREMGFVAALEAARAQGALLILAHPDWTGNSQEDALRWGFHGVEAYNHVCQWLNGKGSAAAFWHWMLRRNPQTLGLAVDDAHVRPEHPGWNGGWVMVQAAERTGPAILEALRAGRFYSSRGPVIHGLECRGTTVHVRCSPVSFVRLVGPDWQGVRAGGFGDQRLTEARFDVPAGWPYAYLEVEDEHGRCAWTNPLFTA